jgi:hypothetical protein
VLVMSAALFSLPLLPIPASAAPSICSASLDGVDATTASSPDSAIEVEEGSSVTASGSMESGPISYDVALEFAGISRSIASGTGEGTNWTNVINVDDYATYGVGLYKVNVTSTNAVGQTCTLSAFVNVKGGALSSVAGVIALTVLVVALLLGIGLPTVIAAFSKAGLEVPPGAFNFSGTCASSMVAATSLTIAALIRSKGLS